MNPTREPSVAEIEAIPDLVERARRLRAITRDRGNLTAAESRLYDATIAALRGDRERETSWIARQIGISGRRVRQLLSRHASRTEVAA